MNRKIRVLCADDFNHRDSLIWTPSPQATPIIGAPSFPLSGKYDPQTIRRGEPCFPTGVFVKPDDFSLKDDFPAGQVSLIIKESGSLTHTLPKELTGLAPALKKISEIQTQVNDDTKRRIGCLIVQVSDVTPGLLMSDGHWHQDYIVPKYVPDVLSLRQRYGFSLRQAFAAKSASLSKVANVYHLSNKCPEWLQAEPLPQGFCRKKIEPMDLASYFTFFPDSVYKSSPYEVVMGNNHVYHRAERAGAAGRKIYAQLAYLDCR